MEAWRWDSSFEPLVETMREFYKLEVPESAWDDPRVRELWRLVRLRDAACSRFGRYIERELDRWEFSKPSVPLIEDSIEVIEALRLEFGDSDELYRAIDEYDAAVRAAIWNGGGDTLNLDQPSSSRVTSAVNELARPAFAALMDILKEKQ